MPVPRRRRARQLGEPDIPRRRSMLPGRQSRSQYQGYISMLPYAGIPRRQYQSYDITKLEDSRLTASQLLTLLPDLSPDVGLAVWNVLRLGSDGFNYTVKDRRGQDDEIGKQMLDNLLPRLNARYGGVNGFIVQLLLTGFLQGAVCAEIALTEGLDDVEDIYAIDPYRIESTLDENGKVVDWFVPASGGRVRMNPETFWYVPIDPLIDDPYGRPPVAPVLQEVWFDIAFITDLRKVVHNQGWPRIDIKIVEEVLLKNAPPSIKNDPALLAEWLNERIVEVQNAYNDLQPDDSFVHFDSVEVAASDSSGRMFDSTAILRAVERRMTKALKQLPILMASNEGTTETHGTVQWQIFAAGLRSLQEPIRFILSRMFRLALEVQGHQAEVECWFEPIRTTDRRADAAAEATEIANAFKKWLYGFQTWEESAIEVTGSGPPEGVTPPDPLQFVSGSLGPQAELRSMDPATARIDAEIEAWLQ